MIFLWCEKKSIGDAMIGAGIEVKVRLNAKYLVPVDIL